MIWAEMSSSPILLASATLAVRYLRFYRDDAPVAPGCGVKVGKLLEQSRTNHGVSLTLGRIGSDQAGSREFMSSSSYPLGRS
jgi:hypothetical protein